MKKYDSYKESGIEWIGAIPEHWELKKLKHLFDIIPSNVDKKSKEDETKVLLCNYVDVYKNDKISFDLNFMVASASASQIDKLTLKQFDVIATKDSEDPNDIGIPALVLDNMNGVVCGYHLTLFRSKQSEILGKYLFWFLKSKMCSQYFSTLARGITRYALGTSAFSNLPLFSIGDINEVSAIVNYLDHKTTQIDTLISKKQKFITLLQEERIAVINQAVTKGLDPKVKMKDSGIEWLGEIPEHWEVKKLKYHLKTTKGFAFKSDLFADKGIPVVKASDIKNKTIRLKTAHYIPEIIAKDYESVRLSKGDILISTVGSTPDVVKSAVGQIGMVPYELEGALLNQNTVRLEILDKNALSNNFLFFLIQNDNYRSYLDLNAHGTANQASLKLVDILGFETSFPSVEEQQKIINHIELELNRINTLISKTQQEIELLKEYKTALISEVVTGKVDVRDMILN